MSLLRTASLAVLALGLSGPLAPAANAAEPNYGAIASDRSPSMVTVKFVIHVSQGGQSEDHDWEAGGVVIDGKTGLILASNVEMLSRFGSPKDIKILIGEDTEGVPAKVVGHDSELELLWLRIEKPSDKGYSAVDPAKAVVPKLGEHLVGLDKMSKYYDRAVVVFDTTVGSLVKKPRPLYVPTGGPVGNVGLPMFNAGGEFVGVTVRQVASSEEGADPSSMGRQTSFDRGAKILPGSEIVTATQRALEAEKSGKTEDGEKKDEEKKDDMGGGGEKKETPPPAPVNPKSDSPKK